jgi:hypothetical protein
MRKIVSPKVEGKKKNKKQLIIGIILIFIMMASTAGYAFSQFLGGGTTSSEKINYNDIQFTKSNGFWIATIQEMQFVFANNPLQVNDTSPRINLTLNDYYQQPLYIYSENTNAESEIYRNLDQIVLRKQYACPEGENCTSDVPVKACNENFIIIKESSTDKILQDNKCIFIEGNAGDLTKLTDEFLFNVIGIR